MTYNINKMKITIDNIEIRDDIVYKCNIFQKKMPHIKSSKVSNNELYTLMIVDPDAPYPSNPSKKYVLHLLIINSKQTKIKYMPPNPPIDSPAHRYQILLFKQKNKIDIEDNINQINFNVNNFKNKYELKLVDEYTFRCKNN
jgi:phosphatidylethanolamine-binding protein (PEBP) family uncharacterized protein